MVGNDPMVNVEVNNHSPASLGKEQLGKVFEEFPLKEKELFP